MLSRSQERENGKGSSQQISSLAPTFTPKSRSSCGSKRASKTSVIHLKEKKSSVSSVIQRKKGNNGDGSKWKTASSFHETDEQKTQNIIDQEDNIISHGELAAQGETDQKMVRKTESKSVQTGQGEVMEDGSPLSSSSPTKNNIPEPISAITLQSILIAARAKSAAKMSPKQFAAYRLSNDIIVMIQQSLQSERDAFGFIGQPIISVVGEQIDRMAWWFWVVQQAVQEMNPPRGYILPALKMLRQEISSLADIAVEMIAVQKTIQKQLHRMASILNNVFARHEDLFGVREWEQKLQELRAEDAAEVQDKFDKWVRQSDEGTVKLTVFENKSMLLQHEGNEEYKPMTLSKLSLASQKEFIKSCLDHMSAVLRWSCDHSLQSHEELLKAEKEMQESIDKLVKKLDHLRKVHRLRHSTCAFLLKRSLHTLGLCFYEFIDMVRFITKLGRFVLLASEHVLRHANRWSHLCDATCLAQLDLVWSEFAKNSRTRAGLLRCLGHRLSNSEEKKNRIMATFEEYFQRWISTNLSTVQVTVPISNESAYVVFGGDLDVLGRSALRRKSRLKPEERRKKESVPNVVSTKELQVEVIHSYSKVSKKVPTPGAPGETKSIQKKLEEIGIKISNAEDTAAASREGDGIKPRLTLYPKQQQQQVCVPCSTNKKASSRSVVKNSSSRTVEKTKTLEPT